MEFEYRPVQAFSALIDIENIGQCALEAFDCTQQCYYLIIRTILGESIIFEYGPIVPDINILPKSFSCSISRIEYNEGRLKKIISTFLMDNKSRSIDSVRELSMKKALDLCINPVEYMMQYVIEESGVL